jgi:osmoprotectant transport system substrate-binding protein
MRRTLTALAATTVATLTLAACGGGSSGGPLGGPAGASAAPTDTISVGSANFTESSLLGEIYAQALEAKGIKVARHLSLGSRETYFPAIKDGSLDLVPDYTGTLLQYLDPKAAQTSPDDVYAALLKAIPAPLVALDKSAAEDKDAVVVSKDVADRYHATSISDLAPHCGDLVFGGPPEFQKRPDGIPGLQRTYGCTFKSYISLDAGGPLTLAALKSNQVQAADLFTTNPQIETDNLVALTDPKSNFAAQNVVPIINSAKATDQVKQILNAVSGKLTTQVLVDLNRQLTAPDPVDPGTAAKQWLSTNGLG